MKVIVFLGNPGKEYENTRHNVGFMLADFMNLEFHFEAQFHGFISTGILKGEKCLFVKPTTYMNESGICVAKVMDYYDVDLQNLLIVQDDMDLNLGSYKLKRNSSSGGHNGIKSIIQALKTDSFLRLKVGVGHDRTKDTIDYVLGKFSKSEKELLTQNFRLYQELLESFILEGTEKTLQNYSKK